MPNRRGSWVRVIKLTTEERRLVADAAERLIAETLKPRFLPEIRPNQFNYPVDVFGRWRGKRYYFVTRYRSGWPDNEGEEFDAPFTCIEHVETALGQARFDIFWRRHNGSWWRQHSRLPLSEAMRLIGTDPILQP